jgi:hypothetical protein
MAADAVSPANADGLKSGSRLKLRWANFEGTKSYSGLFDSQRQDQGTPHRFADNRTYCVTTTNVVECTMPIGPMADNSFFTETDPLTGNNLPAKIFSRGAQLSLPTYCTQSDTLAGTTTCTTVTTDTSTELYALDPARKDLRAFRRDYLHQLMVMTKGNLAKAARIAGLDRSNLRRLLRAHDLSAADYRSKN